VYSGYRDDQKKRMFVDTVRSTLEHMIVSPKDHPEIKLLAELNGDKERHVMDELACFVPGTFLLAADTIPELHDIVGIASELLESCVLAWTSTKTGIAPEIFGWVDPKTGEFPVPKSDRSIELADKYGVIPVVDSYILRPGKHTAVNLILMCNKLIVHLLIETLESIFYFYRYTKDEKYRDMGWKIFESIQLHCRANSGYTGIRYVDSISPEWDDRQERFVITELNTCIIRRRC
jgi:mannosyl-oligosaccharide alpha-1,2-mannosidase